VSALWININRSGGLGNRLFSRAHVYAAAREFGATVADWGLLDQARHFPVLGQGRLPAYPLTQTGAAPELPNHWWLDAEILGATRRLRPRRTGHFGPLWSAYWGSGDPGPMQFDGEAFRLFASSRQVLILDTFKILCVPWLRKHADEVRRFFAPPRAVLAKWTALQDAWHRRWPLTVAVHMRATDFQRAQGGRYYLTPGEFADLLRASPDIDPTQTLFVLFSDQNFLGNADFESLGKAFAGLDHVLMQGSVLDDLVGIGSCDMIVGPVSSTFSRWAAFARNRPWAGAVRPPQGEPFAPLVFEAAPLPWGG
jgi:hypothetical protein